MMPAFAPNGDNDNVYRPQDVARGGGSGRVDRHHCRGKPVSGRPPCQGTPGRGIASVALDEDTAEITITLTDGTIVETGPLRAQIQSFDTNAAAEAYAAANPLALVCSTEVN